MKKTIPPFIIIDYDMICNLITTKVIKHSLGEETLVNSFHLPSEGLRYIGKGHTDSGRTEFTVLFLEVDMPEMDVWEFLKEFEKFDRKIKNQVRIFILSSTLDARIREKALKNKNVTEYLTKPLTAEFLKQLFVN